MGVGRSAVKRIAIVAYHHPESTLPLAKHLARHGCAVDYYYVTASGHSGAPAFDFGRTVYFPGIRRRNAPFMKEIYRYFDGDQVDVLLAVLPPYARRLFGRYSRAFFFRLGRTLRCKKYDHVVVVGQDPFLLDVHRGLGAADNVWHALHEVAPHYDGQRVSYGLVDRLVESGTQVVVHSEAAQQMLVSRYGAQAGRNVRMIPFGVFETYRACDGVSEEAIVEGRYFLFLGTLLPYKGLDVLLDAVEVLGDGLRDFKVVVAGAGSDPAVRRMAANPRFVIIQRYVANREVVNLTRNAVAVVCPYKSASQSGIVSTAFLFGRPIIASDVGGFGEFIETGANGVLTSPGDAEGFAAAMRRLVDDEAFRKRLERGAAAFEGDPRYSWDALAQRYLDLMS